MIISLILIILYLCALYENNIKRYKCYEIVFLPSDMYTTDIYNLPEDKFLNIFNTCISNKIKIYDKSNLDRGEFINKYKKSPIKVQGYYTDGSGDYKMVDVDDYEDVQVANQKQVVTNRYGVELPDSKYKVKNDRDFNEYGTYHKTITTYNTERKVVGSHKERQFVENKFSQEFIGIINIYN